MPLELMVWLLKLIQFGLCDLNPQFKSANSKLLSHYVPQTLSLPYYNEMQLLHSRKTSDTSMFVLAYSVSMINNQASSRTTDII